MPNDIKTPATESSESKAPAPTAWKIPVSQKR